MSAKGKHRVKQSECTHPVSGFHKISDDNNGLKTVNFRDQVTNQVMMTPRTVNFDIRVKKLTRNQQTFNIGKATASEFLNYLTG